MDEHYTVKNAKKFKWSSISGELNPERKSHLEKYLVGKKILDAGCGGGAYVEFLCARGLEVTGIDKYKQFLQIAQQQSFQGTYIQADIVSNLPFPDKAFDSTYCFDVLEHVNDEIAIKELARVTAQRLILAVPKEDNLMRNFNLTFLHYQDKTHLRNYTDKSLEKLIEKINPSKFFIFPELAIPSKRLVQQMLDSNSSTQSKNLVKKSFAKLLPKILEWASYKEVHTGLVAVIDFDN